ncbi:MAG: hypothetical protein IAF08_01200 [Rhizobacter sp.]|nr:hypothetical protein [Chlorobiales bacterium]
MTPPETYAPTPDEESVLDALHFVLNFADLKTETRLEDERLLAAIENLTALELVEVLEWHEARKEFFPPRDIHLPLERYAFLATARGLRVIHSA